MQSKASGLIRARRIEAGYSTRELSELSGVSMRGIVSLEAGGVPRPATVIKLGRTLGMDVEALLGVAREDTAEAAFRLFDERLGRALELGGDDR